MKRAYILLILTTIFVFCFPAYAQQHRSGQYEGGVSLIYHEISLGVETFHGVRYGKSGFFIGGIAGVSFGSPMGIEVHEGVLPRWYFGKSNKGEGYVSLPIMHYTGGVYDPGKDESGFGGGLQLAPEIGIGIKMNKGKAIDIAVRCNTYFMFYDSRYTSIVSELYMISPGVCITFRF